MSSLEVSGVCRSGKHWSMSTRKLALRLGYSLAIYRSNLSPTCASESLKTGLLSDSVREVDDIRTDVFPLLALGGTCVNPTGTWAQHLHSWTVDADSSDPALTDSWQHQESKKGRCWMEMNTSWRCSPPLSVCLEATGWQRKAFQSHHGGGAESPSSLMVYHSEGKWAQCLVSEDTFHLVPSSLDRNHLQLFPFPSYILSMLSPSYVFSVSWRHRNTDPQSNTEEEKKCMLWECIQHQVQYVLVHKRRLKLPRFYPVAQGLHSMTNIYQATYHLPGTVLPTELIVQL